MQLKKFLDVYDRTKFWASDKRGMTLYPVEQLQVKDTVLLEVLIRHFRVQREWESSRGDNKEWVSWRAFFELKAATFVHRENATEMAKMESEAEGVRI